MCDFRPTPLYVVHISHNRPIDAYLVVRYRRDEIVLHNLAHR